MRKLQHWIRFFTLASVLVVLLSSCNFPGEELEQPPQAASDCTPVLPHTQGEGEPYDTILEPFELVAPSGNTLYGYIRRPDPAAHPDLCLAAVVLVPGGINPGRMELARGDEALQLAEAGMVVVGFNAEGRGSDLPEDIYSEGSEDYNGFRQQDGLCAIVEYTMALPYVVADNVGIKTQSFGIAMGAGCAGRYPEIPIKYIVDGEGPPNSFVTCHETAALDEDPDNDKHELIYTILNRYSAFRDPSPENIAFWEEREAERFIGAFRGRYLRLQATWDHAQLPSSGDVLILAEIGRARRVDSGWVGWRGQASCPQSGRSRLGDLGRQQGDGARVISSLASSRGRATVFCWASRPTRPAAAMDKRESWIPSGNGSRSTTLWLRSG